MNNKFEIRRIIRKAEYEKWIVYVSKPNFDTTYDIVYIFFYGNNCDVYLFTGNVQLLKDEDYTLTIENIYHDIGISESDELLHDLKVVEIPSDIVDDDNKIDMLINRTIGDKIQGV